MEDKSYINKPSRMKGDVLCKTIERIKEHVIEHSIKKITIVFHGGEPLLAGPQFFEFAVHFANKELLEYCQISYAIQTNGLLLSQLWIDLFRELRINAGVSLDGYKELNDKYRLDFKGKSTFDKTVEALALLTKEENKKLFGGILCVIQPESDPISLFQWYLKFGDVKIDFLFPHYNHIKKPPQVYNNESGYGYGLWLSKVFDYWWTNDLSEIRIRVFEDVLYLQIL